MLTRRAVRVSCLHARPLWLFQGQPQRRKWRLLLPGASEPRLPLLRRQDFKSVFQTALRGLSNRSIVVVGNYEIGPITAEPCRAKARPLRPRRSCFAPMRDPQWIPELVEAPGTAPGSDRFITTAIYRHSRQAGMLNINAALARGKGNGGCRAPRAQGDAEQPHNISAGIPELSVDNNGA
jgi:hypothetical protein